MTNPRNAEATAKATDPKICFSKEDIAQFKAGMKEQRDGRNPEETTNPNTATPEPKLPTNLEVQVVDIRRKWFNVSTQTNADCDAKVIAKFASYTDAVTFANEFARKPNSHWFYRIIVG